MFAGVVYGSHGLAEGWPCPAFISATGDTFHFSPIRAVLGADLLGGTSFVIQ